VARGSATDILARVMAERFTRTLGQPFLVENKPGAGGVNPAIYAKLGYDPIRDFELIGNIVLTPQALVVGVQTPYMTLKDFVLAAKAKPGEIAYASLGSGSTSHLTMEAFMSAAGIKLNHVPFKGSGDAIPKQESGARAD
jgi:tripartite-type tricarboxylate transporter receptor subunit TctC